MFVVLLVRTLEWTDCIWKKVVLHCFMCCVTPYQDRDINQQCLFFLFLSYFFLWHVNTLKFKKTKKHTKNCFEWYCLAIKVISTYIIDAIVFYRYFYKWQNNKIFLSFFVDFMFREYIHLYIKTRENSIFFIWEQQYKR